MRFWFQTIILSALIGLFGCAHPVSEKLRKDLDPTLTFERLLEAPEEFIGKRVMFGGVTQVPPNPQIPSPPQLPVPRVSSRTVRSS